MGNYCRVCRLTAKNRDQLQNPTLGGRIRDTFTFFTKLGLHQSSLCLRIVGRTDYFYLANKSAQNEYKQLSQLTAVQSKQTHEVTHQMLNLNDKKRNEQRPKQWQ